MASRQQIDLEVVSFMATESLYFCCFEFCDIVKCVFREVARFGSNKMSNDL